MIKEFLMTIPRPTRFDASIRTAIATQLAPAVLDWLDDATCSLSDIIRDLENVFNYYDLEGYALAKSLENRGYIPDSNLVEILDRAYFIESKVVKDATTQWVIDNNIVPAYAIGHVVTYKPSTYGPKLTGEIVRIDESTAKYHIFCEADGHVREGVGTHAHIVPYELVLTSVVQESIC